MISYKDMKNNIKNAIVKNKDMQFIFGNTFIVSILITVILILIFTLNSDNLVANVIYSFFAVLIIVLIENTIIKNHYKNKSSDSTIFDNMEVKTGSKEIITPRKFSNSITNIIPESNNIDANGDIERLMERMDNI